MVYFHGETRKTNVLGVAEVFIERCIETLIFWSLVRRKPGVLRPGFIGMRGQWSYDYGMQNYEYTPLPPILQTGQRHSRMTLGRARSVPRSLQHAPSLPNSSETCTAIVTAPSQNHLLPERVQLSIHTSLQYMHKF